MNHVIDACCTFLEQQLEAGNAIGIASFAQQHGCMDLYRKANTFIEQHFSEVSMCWSDVFHVFCALETTVASFVAFANLKF